MYDGGLCQLLYPPGAGISGFDSLLILGAGTSIRGGILRFSNGRCPPVNLEADAITGSNLRVWRDPAADLRLVSGTVTVQTVPQSSLKAFVADELNGRMDFDLIGQPGSAAALLASPPAAPAATPFGLTWLDLNAYMVADLGVVDATGHRLLSFRFPDLVPVGQLMQFQSIVFDGSRLHWSTPAAMVRN